MNIEQILKKITAGESLTDEEKTFLGSYDPKAAIDSAAAGARKEAEAKLAKANEANAELSKTLEALKAENEGKKQSGNNDLAAAQNQISELSKSLEKMKADIAEKDKAVQLAQRKAALDGIRTKAGIQFAPGLDPDMLNGSFERAFEGLEDLSDETVIAQTVEAFKQRNAAAILDTSGHGSGAKPGQTTPPAKEPTMEERAEQLSKAGVV